jgi:signal recognition particle GTPase
MSHFWLTCRQSGRFAGIVLVEANSLLSARKRAATKTGRRIQFASCTELLEEFAKLVPPTEMGRMLSPNDAAKLVRRFERGILKWQASSPVRRVAKPRAAAPRA